MRRMTWVLLMLLLGSLVRPGASAQGASVPDLVAGNTAFALDLYAELRQNEDLVPADGNLLLSPYSISQALAMTYAGARGETATQMAETFSFQLSQAALHEAFSALNRDLIERGNAEDDPANYVTGRGLRIANGLWGEQTYPFSEAYNAQLAQSYGVELHQSDFINAPEEARQDINAWVADQTNDRIQEIVPEDAITPETLLVLANAIYFHSAWLSQFSPSDTRDDEFHLLNGTTVTVPFMFQQSHLNYARGDGFQVIELDYAGDMSGSSGFAFTVILPDEGQFEAFEAGFDADTLNAAIDQLAYTEVLVYLPKFEFDFGTDLVPTLKSMGMVDAFDPARANFTGMVEETPPTPLYISDVLHKAFISVDEDGTEAGAATVVIGVGAPPPAAEPPEVRIDRPFIFAIRDTQTGSLLFLGRVMDPNA